MTPALSGCATVGHFKGLGFNDDAVYVSGVTPIRQDKNHACGPACVAAVASHWGVSLADFKAAQQLIIDDPASGPMLVREDKFIDWWAQKDRLCVLIATPPALLLAALH